jgi:hypothetical protein
MASLIRTVTLHIVFSHGTLLVIPAWHETRTSMTYLRGEAPTLFTAIVGYVPDLAPLGRYH